MAKAKSSQRTIPPLVVRYPRRMRPQQVYAAQVTWQSREKPKLAVGAQPYTVRLIMPGSQVIPTEQSIDPAKPASRAVFYVTPLARRGWLRGERLEILVDGEKVQEIGLPAKVVSNRLTWILLLLTFLLPWFVATQIQMNDEQYNHAVKKGSSPWAMLLADVNRRSPVSPTEVHNALVDGLETVGVDRKNATDEVKDAGEGIGRLYDWLYALIVRDNFFAIRTNYQANIPFWLAVALLVLTIVSWFLHRVKYARRIGRPLPVAEE